MKQRIVHRSAFLAVLLAGRLWVLLGISVGEYSRLNSGLWPVRFHVNRTIEEESR